MRVTLFRLLGALTLGVIALAVSSGRFALPTLGSSISPSGDWVAAAGLSSQHVSPLVTDASSRGTVQQGGAGQSGCSLYDSWCDYCTRNADPEVCKLYIYGATTGTGTTGSTSTTGTSSSAAPAHGTATPTPTAAPTATATPKPS